MSLEPKPRTRTSQAGRGEREGRVNVILGPALKRRAETRKEFPGWSPYVRALVEADLKKTGGEECTLFGRRLSAAATAAK